MKVSELLVRSLEEYGTKRAYGLVGTSVIEVMDALRGSGIRYVSTRHEQVAVSMADAEGRLTGAPGVAIVHGGPGFLNSIVSLSNAYKDGSPLLLVAGAVKRRMVGMDSWLEVPQSEMVSSLVKRAFRVERGSAAGGSFSAAYSVAASDPKGPVLVEIPEDVWPQDAGSSVVPLKVTCALDPPGADVQRVSEALASAERPLLVVGGGVNNPRGFKALTSLLSKLEVPVVTSGNGRGAVPEDNPLVLGRIGFGGGSTASDTALKEADLVVCLGCGLSDVSTYGFNITPRGEVMVVDLDPLWDKKPVPCALHSACDAAAFAEQLARLSAEHKLPESWKATIRDRKSSWEAVLREGLSRDKDGYVNPARFLRALDEALPEDKILTAGQGMHILYTYAYMKVRTPRGFLAATNMGSMGFGFPAALGAKLSCPKREVVAVVGDGEFVMTMHDLETAVRERVGVKVVIVNDNSYRVLLMRQKIQKMGRVFGTLHSNPDICKLAEAFGTEAMVVRSNAQVEEGVRFITKRSDVPLIVELKVDQDDLPPLNLEGSLMF
jgi:acetolactate synthase-1/2/3 large subunit